MKHTLSASMSSMLQKIESIQSSSPRLANYPNLTSFFGDLKSRYEFLALSDDEMDFALDMDKKNSFEDRLNKYSSMAVAAHLIETGERSVPDFLKSGGKTNEDFFRGMIEALANDTVLQERVKLNGGEDFAAISSAFDELIAIYETMSKKSENRAKIMEAVDIKQ